jgi:glycosyltransferase involved in cell wall biosynthesis
VDEVANSHANEPVVTIGLCTRNEEKTIAHTISSIAAQDFSHDLMELVIIDDSDDNTFQLIQENVLDVDFEVKVLRGAKKGLGFARNTLIDLAKGKYIAWVDGDIMIPPDHIRRQVEYMELNQDVGIAKARFYAVPQKGLVPALENLEWVAIEHLIRSKGGEDLPSYLTGGSIHRTKAVRQIGGFDTKIVGAGEDEEIEWRMSNAGWKVHSGTGASYYEWRKQTWKALWDNHFWYGHGAYYLYHKKVRTLKFFTLMSGFLFSRIAYQLTHDKVSFLLPIQYYFKRIAWLMGLAKAYIAGYGSA